MKVKDFIEKMETGETVEHAGISYLVTRVDVEASYMIEDGRVTPGALSADIYLTGKYSRCEIEAKLTDGADGLGIEMIHREIPIL